MDKAEELPEKSQTLVELKEKYPSIEWYAIERAIDDRIAIERKKLIAEARKSILAIGGAGVFLVTLGGYVSWPSVEQALALKVSSELSRDEKLEKKIVEKASDLFAKNNEKEMTKALEAFKAKGAANEKQIASLLEEMQDRADDIDHLHEKSRVYVDFMRSAVDSLNGVAKRRQPQSDEE